MSSNEIFGPFQSKKSPPFPTRKPPVPSYYGVVTEDLKDFIKKGEGKKRFPYKDSEGNITIGVGKMIPNLEEFRELPLYMYEGINPTRKARPEDIDDAWNRIKSLNTGHNIDAEKYNPEDNNNLSNIGLQDPDIEFLLEGTLRQSAYSLDKKLPKKLEDYSRSPRTGLIDMEFNLGPNGFTREKWPALYGALDREDWEAVAKESHRKIEGAPGIEERNQRTYKIFMDGVLEKKKR